MQDENHLEWRDLHIRWRAVRAKVNRNMVLILSSQTRPSPISLLVPMYLYLGSPKPPTRF